MSSSKSFSRWSFSTQSNSGYSEDVKLDPGDDEDVGKEHDEIIGEKLDLTPQGVDPRRGWGYRGVHKVLDGNRIDWCKHMV